MEVCQHNQLLFLTINEIKIMTSHVQLYYNHIFNERQQYPLNQSISNAFILCILA